MSASQTKPPPRFRAGSPAARIWSWLIGGFVKHLNLDPRTVTRLEELHRQGHVTYVFRHYSLLDYTILRHVLRRHGLPEPLYANRVSRLFWGTLREWLRHFPVRIMWRLAGREPREGAEEVYRDAIRTSEASLVALHLPEQSLRRGGLEQRPYILQTLKLAEEGRQVALVPVLVLWERKPRRVRRTLTDIFLGEVDNPGRVRKVRLFVNHYKSLFLKIGEPIVVDESASAREGEEGRQEGAKKLRRILLYYLAREERVVTGPPLIDRRDVIDGILNDQEVRDQIIISARERTKSNEAVAKEAHKLMDEIVADYDIRYIEFLDWVFHQLYKRLWEDIHVDTEGLERVRQAAREASIVFVPTHRSHMDYLILPWVFYHNELTTPHICAGVNLNFWPMGHIFRHAGAYFIRRSFKGDDLYALLLRKYVTYLLKRGFPQIFYIEGTRSRTGKLLQPRMGMLQMILSAQREEGAEHLPIRFMPVNITYEKVLEGASYKREQEGAKKEKENVATLAKASKLLGNRFGRVYVTFDHPIDPAEILSRSEMQDVDVEVEDQRPVRRLADEISRGINRQATVTPSVIFALVALTHRKRGINTAKLMQRAELLTDYLQFVGANLTADFDDLRPAMERCVELFVNDNVIARYELDEEKIYRVIERQRSLLDYYKNNAIHFFAPASLAAGALLADLVEGEESLKTSPVKLEDAARSYRFLVELLGDEFFVKVPEEGDSEPLRERLAWFLGNRLLEIDEDHGHIGFGQTETYHGVSPLKALSFFSLITYHYQETYYLVLESLGHVTEEEIDEKEFSDFALERGRKFFLVGNILKQEALAKTTIETALRSFKRKGLYSIETPESKRRKKARKMVLDEEQNNRRRDLMRELKRFFEYHKGSMTGL